MYHCERHVQLDRSFLQVSLERRRLGNRTLARQIMQFKGDGGAKRPRPVGSRAKEEKAFKGGGAPAQRPASKRQVPQRQTMDDLYEEDWSSDGTELQDEQSEDDCQALDDDDNDEIRGVGIAPGMRSSHLPGQLPGGRHGEDLGLFEVGGGAEHIAEATHEQHRARSSDDESDPGNLKTYTSGDWNLVAQSEIDDNWQALDSACIEDDLGFYQDLRRSFPLQGYAHVPGLIPPDIIAEINAAADRRGSRARRNSKTISGSTIQMDTELFTQSEQTHVQALVSTLLNSSVVQVAASALWGGGRHSVPMRAISCSILEGGTQQMPHADALYASALVVLISLRESQAPTTVHRDLRDHSTSFSWLVAPTHEAPDEEAEERMDAALNAIAVVAQPDVLNMVPATEQLLGLGDALLMTSTLVHAGPGGMAADGSPRRVAFVTLEPVDSQGSEGYDPSLQYNAALYWFRRCHGNQQKFFKQLHATRDRWIKLGHDPTTFLTDEGAERYQAWVQENRFEEDNKPGKKRGRKAR